MVSAGIYTDSHQKRTPMKNSYSIVAALLFVAGTLLPEQTNAQSPEKMSYQAVVRDGNDALVSNASVGMRISILQGSTTGTAVYVETQSCTSNVNGLVSTEIGSGTVDLYMQVSKKKKG